MNAVTVDRVAKTFSGGVTAVDGLSFAVPEGEFFGFLGPNGAGKTTCIRMITGLLAASAGRIEVMGEAVKPGALKARELVGVCPQEIVLWEKLTCAENLRFMGRMYNVPRARVTERADELLGLLGLRDKKDARVETLSGGMKRRLNVAMALVHDPKVVVLDEPEAGLDPQARIVLREFLAGLRADKTVLFTTHNMDEAERLVDRVAIIDHGKLLALDTPQALKRQYGEGDVLEVTLPDAELASHLCQRLGVSHPDLDVRALDAEVVIRGLHLASRFGDILREVESGSYRLDDVRYRGNSLEDVFIALTGRGLRE